MNRTLIYVLGFGTLVGSVSLKAAEDPGIALPPVPRELLLAANDAPGTIRHVSAGVSVEDAPEVREAPAATLALGPKTVRVSPGTTAIVEVAIDHLNRIVTPSTSPQVRTVSRATTQVDGNAIYVATASEEPVSLSGVGAEPGARRLRVRKVGRGERLNCRQPALSVSTAQVFEGRGLRILAAMARNRGKQPIVLEEHRCNTDSGAVVAAVAAWPRSRLAPGEETELYVAVRPGESSVERGDHPSLLGGR
jgi:hypothetical protein